MVKRCKSKLWISAGGWKGFGNLRVRERFKRQKESDKAMKKVINLLYQSMAIQTFLSYFFLLAHGCFCVPFFVEVMVKVPTLVLRPLPLFLFFSHFCLDRTHLLLSFSSFFLVLPPLISLPPSLPPSLSLQPPVNRRLAQLFQQRIRP